MREGGDGLAEGGDEVKSTAEVGDDVAEMRRPCSPLRSSAGGPSPSPGQATARCASQAQSRATEAPS